MHNSSDYFLYCLYSQRESVCSHGETIFEVQQQRHQQQQQQNRPLPGDGQLNFTPQTFLKFRFRVLFWRHSQTQLIGSLNDQIRSLPVPISSRQEPSDIGAKTVEEPSMACLLLRHVTDVSRAAVRSKGSRNLEKDRSFNTLATLTRGNLIWLFFLINVTYSNDFVISFFFIVYSFL